MPLGPLVQKARELDVIGADLEAVLVQFTDMRNDFVHDLEYRLEPSRVEDIKSKLPMENQELLERAYANVFPSIPDGTAARLVLENVVVLTFEAVAATHRRAYGAEETT
jgi:hypothetical protein